MSGEYAIGSAIARVVGSSENVADSLLWQPAASNMKTPNKATTNNRAHDRPDNRETNIPFS